MNSWCKILAGEPGVARKLKNLIKKKINLNLPVTPRAQNLRQGIVMKTSFGTQISRMGLGSFMDINIFEKS